MTTLSRPTLGEEVYEVLLSQLISLKIPPEKRISVDALVRELGVSQTPIRAALIRLESEGLVVRRPNAGYSAAPMPTGRKFEEIYEVRLLLEPHAAAQAARAADREGVDALRELSNAMDELQVRDAASGYGQFAILDAKFHARLWELAGNALIANTLALLYTHMHLFRLRFHSAVARDAVQEHMAVIHAIQEGNPQAAAAAMERHVVASRDRVAPYFEKLD